MLQCRGTDAAIRGWPQAGRVGCEPAAPFLEFAMALVNIMYVDVPDSTHQLVLAPWTLP